MIYPIKLKAPLKDYIWGGTTLLKEYGKESTLSKVAESWELAIRKDDNSVIINGACKGMYLADFINKYGKQYLGKNGNKFDDFPVLIKFIDANDMLSVQVHPDNEYALRVEGEYGKTEVWYIMDAEPDARLIYGFKKDTNKEEVRENIENGTLLNLCNSISVKKGDVFFIPAGTIHAIGKGILVAEIQQNSNTTYRVFDYNRKDDQGNERELHIDKALDVLNYKGTSKADILDDQSMPEQELGYTRTLISECDYFKSSLLEVCSLYQEDVGEDSFVSLLCLEGSLEFQSGNGDETLTKGESMFLPANYGSYELSGNGTVVRTVV